VSAYHLHPYNENSLLIEFPGLSLDLAHAEVQYWYAWAKHNWGHWIINLVPAYESLLVVCNSPSAARDLKLALEGKTMETIIEKHRFGERMVTIPVCYDTRLGNDLDIMAAYHNLEINRIVEIHINKLYHVYLLGFLPGFAYMGEVDERIAMPRKEVPIFTRAGAVGIAAKQTGIYPLDSPGGWHIVGYTPLKMFDITKKNPALLQPGDKVKFEIIDLETYKNMLENGST
jgi:inhibitor of KinA